MAKNRKHNRNRLSSKIYLAEQRRDRNRIAKLFRTLRAQPFNYGLREVLNAIRPDLVDAVDREQALKARMQK